MSTYSGGGNCVTVRIVRDGPVAVWHSREPARELTFTADEWDAFVRGVKDGQFDPA